MPMAKILFNHKAVFAHALLCCKINGRPYVKKSSTARSLFSAGDGSVTKSTTKTTADSVIWALEHIGCPITKRPLRFDSRESKLINEDAGIAYKVNRDTGCFILTPRERRTKLTLEKRKEPPVRPREKRALMTNRSVNLESAFDNQNNMHHNNNQYSLVPDRDGGGDAELRHSPSLKKKYSEVELNLMDGQQSPHGGSHQSTRQLQEDRRNVAFKYIALFTLVIQCTAAALLMRYVRTVPGERFISSTAVVMQEVIKLAYCVIHLTFTHRSLTSATNEINREVISKPYDTLKVAVPAFIYALQNNLIYVAVSNLDAATYQVTYQLKILTTALCSVIMLKRILGGQQWLALFMLFVGVAIVQVDQNASSGAAKTPAKDVNPLLGLIVVLVCSMTSGFAGVYFEKVLKSSKVSIWIRNIQLSAFGLLVSLFGAYVNDWHEINTKGFFHGYNSLVWTVILIQALGGLLVAMVVKYADNILKGFATSASIIVSCLFVIFAFGVHLSAMFLFGAALVGLATFLYSTGERAVAANVSINTSPTKAALTMKS